MKSLQDTGICLPIGLQDPEGVTSMLRRRASDEKVMVRKAAVQTLESAIRLAGPAYKQQVTQG